MPINVSLVMFKSDGTRRDFPVTRDKVVVGRKHDCDLRIPLTSVSRKHCELQLDEDQVKMRDLGSSNGSYHNNIRVQEAVLSAGDELVIGPVVFTLVIDGQPEKIKPVRTILDDDSKEEQSSNHDQSLATQAEPSSVRGQSLSEPPPTQESEPEPLEADQSSPTVDLDEDPNTSDPSAALEQIDQGQNANDQSGSQAPIDLDAQGQNNDDEIEILDIDDDKGQQNASA